MPRKLQACKECKKPCHGKRCSPCAHAQPGGTGFGRHPSVNSVGEFNASGGFAGPAGIAFPKIAPTAGSWWADHLTREEHQQMAEAHAKRMSAGPCGNHRADNLGVINWNY
jgi:hypothetical protein